MDRYRDHFTGVDISNRHASERIRCGVVVNHHIGRAIDGRGIVDRRGNNSRHVIASIDGARAAVIDIDRECGRDRSIRCNLVFGRIKHELTNGGLSRRWIGVRRQAVNAIAIILESGGCQRSSSKDAIGRVTQTNRDTNGFANVGISERHALERRDRCIVVNHLIGNRPSNHRRIVNRCCGNLRSSIHHIRTDVVIDGDREARHHVVAHSDLVFGRIEYQTLQCRVRSCNGDVVQGQRSAAIIRETSQ